MAKDQSWIADLLTGPSGGSTDLTPKFARDLPNTTGPAGGRQILFLDGHTTTGDGGGGGFYWDANHTGPGDNILTFVPGGGSGPAWTREWDQKQIDIRWGGALPGVATDANTALIQAVVDLAGKTYDIFFPPALVWIFTYPILVKAVGATICGAYANASTASGGNRSIVSYNGGAKFGGPMFLLGGSAFVSGGTPVYYNRAGFDWFESGVGPQWINLGELPYCGLHGLSSFTCEAMVNVTAPLSSDNYIVASLGKRTNSGANASAFQFAIVDLGSGNYGLSFVLQTSGGSYSHSTTGTKFVGGADTKVAFSYDGSTGTMRLYAGPLGGSMAVVGTWSTTGTGETIVQKWYETFAQGVLFNVSYGQHKVTNTPHYQITGLRLSDAARYTAGSYTVETTPLVYDSSTMELFTFAPASRFDVNTIKSQSKYLAGNFVYHDYQDNRDQGTSDITFHDLQIDNLYGFGVRADAVPGCRFERVQSSAIIGVYLFNNCYGNTFRDCWFQSEKGGGLTSGGYGAGIMLRNACGLSEIRNCQVRTAWQWAFAAINGSDAHFSKNYNLSDGLGNYYFSECDPHLTDEYPTDETGTITEACMLLNNCFEVRVKGNELQNNTHVGGAKLVLVDGGSYLRFDTNYQSSSTPAFSFVSAPAFPVIADGANTGAIFTACDMVDSAAPGLVVQTADTTITIDFTADANQTSTDNQFTRANNIHFTDVMHNLTATRVWTIPYVTVDGYKKTWINSTHEPITVQGASGTGITIANGKSATTITLGGNVVRLTADA